MRGPVTSPGDAAGGKSRRAKGERNMMKVFSTAEVGGKSFAILIDDKTMQAYEAVYLDGGWETDFDYPSIGVDSMDVAGALDFEGARKAGYRFPEDK